MEWRDVPSFNKYEVSDYGQVRRILIDGDLRTYRYLKLSMGASGHVMVGMSQGGKKYATFAHRLVWLTFRGPIPPELVINHINGIPNDNRLKNLEVVTNRENVLHGLRLRKKGFLPVDKLSIMPNCLVGKDFLPATMAARYLRLSITTFSLACSQFRKHLLPQRRKTHKNGRENMWFSLKYLDEIAEILGPERKKGAIIFHRSVLEKIKPINRKWDKLYPIA